MSHTTAPPFVRLTSLTVAGARRSRGVKRLAANFETDKEVRTTRAKAWRHCPLSRKLDISTALASHDPLSHAHIPLSPTTDLEERPRDEPLPSSGVSPAPEDPGDSPGSIDLSGKISADANGALLSPNSSYESLANPPRLVECNVVPTPKRRVDWEGGAEESPSDAVHHASPAKKPRTSEPNLNLHSGPKSTFTVLNPLLIGEPLNPLHAPEDDRFPASTVATRNLGESPPSASTEPSPASSDKLVAASCVSRWQAPRSSPLGPKTSPYHRRSKISSVPSILQPSFAKGYLIRNVIKDNIARNPYKQNAQWCEDLHALGLSERYHPMYICDHKYHPSDPDYDEEWSNESWSDEEWSDSEDTLPTPADDDQSETSVTIIGSEEQPPSNSGGTFTFVHWNDWQPPLPLPSHLLDIHPPLVSRWDASKGVNREIQDRRDDLFTGTTEYLPTA